ncbi:MAG: hypothetical protein H5T72_01825 [Actinobacteria bacterium]|nr:hypothetical protein [Actinomycetota bacterium]
MGECSTIVICGRRITDYVLSCLSQFNNGKDLVELKAVAGNITRGVEIAHILKSQVQDIILEKCEIETTKIIGVDTPCLDINLRFSGQRRQKTEEDFREVLAYPYYHLLFDRILHKYGKLSISRFDDVSLLDILHENGCIKCVRADGYPDANIYFKGVGSFLYRSSMILPANWKEVSNVLSASDDVIIGVDTNILYNCSLTEHLIPSLSVADIKKYVHTPNWILLVIPSAVMHELEEASNIRDDKGFLQVEGRIGYRALQEILELSEGTDIEGVSVVIVGETNPILDTRVELQGLRSDFCRMGAVGVAGGPFLSKKKSSGDMIIRDQFKSFLRQIGFHKGIYFMTADKSNAALSRAEGLNSILLVFPFEQLKNNKEFLPPAIDDNGRYRVNVPLGKLIYEAAVENGTIKITYHNGKTGRKITLHCDSRGETLDNWVQRNLFFREDDLGVLQEDYDPIFSFREIGNIWRVLAPRLGYEI